jgi:acyl-CoA reductase-like NAD-dependent aldehyde dehydrogenase
MCVPSHILALSEVWLIAHRGFSFAVFAPIALIQSYETVEEAIELANGTKYGLGASVFGPDETYAIQVAKQIKCGMVSVNDYAVFYVRFPCRFFSAYLVRPLTSRIS